MSEHKSTYVKRYTFRAILE